MSDNQEPQTAEDMVVLAEESEEPDTPTVEPYQPANKHQAKMAERRMNELLRYLASRNAPVNLNTLDVNNLRAKAEAFTACRMLIEKGICTEAEVQHSVYTQISGLLEQVLQIVEQQQLNTRRPVVVRKGGLILPKD